MIKVKECSIAHPINTLAGLCIVITGEYNELSIIGKDKAKKLAKEKGFDPEGMANSYYPVLTGLNTYTKSYWFFDKIV